MRQSGRIREQVFAFDSPSIRKFFEARHPVKTAHHVAAAAKVSLRAAQKWLDGDAEPSFVPTCRLFAAYGPEFQVLCLPFAPWLCAAAAMAQRERLTAGILALEAQLDQLPDLLEGR